MLSRPSEVVASLDNLAGRESMPPSSHRLAVNHENT